MPCPAEPGIFGVARLGQRRRRGFPHDPPGPGLGFGVGLHRLLELEQERGVFISGEQPEEHPVGQLEGSAGSGPLELEQAAVLGDSAHVLHALGGRGRQAEQISTPDPVVLLLLDYGERRFRLDYGQLGRLDDLGEA